MLRWGIFAASLMVPQGQVKEVEKLESYLLWGGGVGIRAPPQSTSHWLILIGR